jgi:3-phenylpropionate/cinnamic acid dioxygenase small subunit
MALTTADRVEVAELFGRYCHLVDHGAAEAWAALFTDDGVFEVEGIMRMQGVAQLQGMPGVVAQQGGGKWRHQITNIVCADGAQADTADVRAYGLVTDWGRGGAAVSFTDYEITLRRVGETWRIAALLARMV